MPSEPVWNSPQGTDHTVSARNGLTRSRTYGERPHSHGKCLLYRAGLASEVTAGQYLLIRSLPDSTIDFGVFRTVSDCMRVYWTVSERNRFYG